MEKELIAEKNGFKVYIAMEDDPLSPREWDNLGKLACFNSKDCWIQEGEQKFNDAESFLEWWKENGEGGLCLPVYAYIHSGIVLSLGNDSYPFNDKWDSGLIGFIYATKERILEEWKVKKISKKIMEKVKNIFKSEIETLNQYYNGDVWGYILEDKEGKQIDSCWGFYGREDVEKEAEALLSNFVKNSAKEYLEEKEYDLKLTKEELGLILDTFILAAPSDITTAIKEKAKKVYAKINQ